MMAEQTNLHRLDGIECLLNGVDRLPLDEMATWDNVSNAMIMVNGAER